MRKWCGCIFLFLSWAVFANQKVDIQTKYLAQQIRCLVCQGQSIEDSNAPFALELKQRIRGRLSRGQSEEEILKELEKQYGTQVLLRPPWQPSTYLLWLTPFIFAGILGGVLGYKVLFKRKSNGNLIVD